MSEEVSDGSGYEACLAALDRAVTECAEGRLTTLECEEAVYVALAAYFDDDGPGDDVDFLLAFARQPFQDRADDPIGGDRRAVDDFDRRVGALLHHPVAKADLAVRLEAVRAEHERSAAAGVLALQELCAHGWRDHPRVFMFRESATTVLALAVELRAVGALEAAVSPEGGGGGQLGHPDAFGGDVQREALDGLAALAAVAGSAGAPARDALVGLTGFAETAPLAIYRLPAHLLTVAHRRRLLKHLEAFLDLAHRDPLFATGGGVDRLPDAIRSVLWLSNDAAQDD